MLRFRLSTCVSSILIALVGCSTDHPIVAPPTTPAEDSAAVASVTVLGVPTEPLLLGSMLQLVAQASDSAGDLLWPDYAVSWRVSDTSVAVISAEGHVETRAVGVTTITANVDDVEGSALLDIRDGGIIRVMVGGAFNAEGDDVIIQADHHSTAADLPVTMQYTGFPGPDARLLAGTAVDVRPSSVVFLKPVWLAIKWPVPLPSGIAFGDLAIYEWTGTTWEELDSNHMVSGYVTAYISRTGVFAMGIADTNATP